MFFFIWDQDQEVKYFFFFKFLLCSSELWFLIASKSILKKAANAFKQYLVSFAVMQYTFYLELDSSVSRTKRIWN